MAGVDLIISIKIIYNYNNNNGDFLANGILYLFFNINRARFSLFILLTCSTELYHLMKRRVYKANFFEI